MVLQDKTKHVPSSKLLNNAPMERCLRRFKSGWIPTTGYHIFNEAKHSVIEYITE